jgi:hypothetical protein
MPRRLHCKVLFWVIAWFAVSPAGAQSKFAPVFERFAQSGNHTALISDLFDAARSGVDATTEVPVLLDFIQSNRSSAGVEEARGWICILASNLLLRLPSAETLRVFQRAADLFESQLDLPAGTAGAKWAVSIVSLTAFIGIQPSPRGLTIIYGMTDDADDRAQGVAIGALARLRPLPARAKALLLSRSAKISGKLSGPVVFGSLTFAADDPDVLQTLLKYAESQNVEEQFSATQALAGLNPIPPVAIEEFRRLESRPELDQNVLANVKGALDRAASQIR